MRAPAMKILIGCVLALAAFAQPAAAAEWELRKLAAELDRGVDAKLSSDYQCLTTLTCHEGHLNAFEQWSRDSIRRVDWELRKSRTSTPSLKSEALMVVTDECIAGYTCLIGGLAAYEQWIQEKHLVTRTFPSLLRPDS